MTRNLIAIVLLLALAPVARAQDMPLSQILIDGEGWRVVEGNPVKPEGRGNLVAKSLDGATQFSFSGTHPRLLAHQLQKDGTFGLGVTYGFLRTRWGASAVYINGLAVDKDGRIYVLTEEGVQVFDPTGRLCGVLTPVGMGINSHLAFEGDQLTFWNGPTKYTRTLRTTGIK